MVVLLNGAPRSGKTSAARVLERIIPGSVVLGVDAWMAITPKERLPGIGLRPGGERPDLEPFVRESYLGLWKAVRRLVDAGSTVICDVGLHASYLTPLDAWSLARASLQGIDTLWVGLRCPVEVVAERRRHTGMPATQDVLQRWEAAVHQGHAYDLDLNASLLSPEEIAHRIDVAIRSRLGDQI